MIQSSLNIKCIISMLVGRLCTLLLLSFHVDTVAALLQPLQRVYGRNSPQGLRSQTHIEAITKWGETLRPLKQTKLDFLGTLEKQYEINKTNRASSIFLSDLVGESSPDLLRRLMVETFEDVAPGCWRIVYAQDLATSFGFGSLFRDVREAYVELGNHGEITCNIKYHNQTPHRLTIEGSFGVVSNSLLIKVSNVKVERSQEETQVQGEEGLFQDIKNAAAPQSIAQSILETQWKSLFSGTVVVRINFLDDNLAVFDLDFLGRVTGRHICARKEPDFF
mmetsp:Transcript_6183/g.9645  ORF Transcript_6183/g.9645 Transcript_6183/m.9645 type:complete len:278 (-) Transcript_6183:86-919(-)